MDRILTPGLVLAGRYEILAPLGRGGMAHVYRARHRGLDREVALKIIRARSDDATFGERFAREARTAARLDHPGCIRVIDSGSAGGVRFLAMELLPGPSLRIDLDRDGAFDGDQVIPIARQLLDALAHAHDRGVLHRDVKPENVVWADADHTRVVLIDFGLSRLEEDAPLTATGACVGSPSYLAPERLRQLAYDGRADLYALGILLYELLAGERPFSGKSSLAIARKHLEEPPPPLAERRPDLPPALIALVDRALAKEPAERFADAAAMRAALDAIDLPEDSGSVDLAFSSDRLDVARLRPARSTEESTYIRAEPAPPSGPRRAWAALRFGRWRWRRRALALPPAVESSV
jgi:eukaryotic-like serine/threonine-protein kinase